MGLTVTARDAEMVRFVGRMRLATAAQLARALGSNRRSVCRRAHRLAAAGLLRYRRVYSGRAGVYLATNRGLALCGSTLVARELDLLRYRHDLAVVTLCLDLLAAHPGSIWRSEREMRSELVPGEGRHTPDGVLVVPGHGAVAIELEITPKRLRALGRILRFYARCREYTTVRYFLPEEAALARYRRLMAPYGHMQAELWAIPADALPPA